MNFRTPILAVLLGTAAVPTVAAGLEGFFVDGSLNHVATMMREVDLSGGQRLVVDSMGKSSIGATLGGGYGLRLGASAMILAGATFDVGRPQAFETSYSTGGASSYRQHSRYGVYVAPGVVFHENTLVYAKLSANRMKITSNIVANGAPDASYNGVGYGAGVRVLMTDRLYLNVEFQRVLYESRTFDISGTPVEIKPSQTIGTIGIGYAF